MTCIVGIVDDGKVYMGCDSAGVAGSHITKRKDSKVFENNGFLIGYTSSFRMGQLLRFNFIPPEYRENKKDLYEYMCTDFIDSVRSCFKSGGYAKKSNEVESAGVFLVGYKGRLFEIESDYQVGESLKSYTSVGCGEFYAKGCLYSIIDNKEISVVDKIKKALSCAEEFSTGVCSPFKVIQEL